MSAENLIHPSAVIDKSVELGKGVKIGPFTMIQGEVQIGDGTEIGSHVCIGSEYGRVKIGSNNKILPGAMVGGAPQDLSFNNEKTELVIGDGNTIREFVTINVGTTKDHGVTRIGNNGLFMAYTHIAHDCVIGNNVVMANSIQLAGHVEIGDYARVGGMVGIVQFCRIGSFAYIAGYSAINKDILPYCIASGQWATPRVTNKVGLERAGYTKEEIASIHKSVRILIKGEGSVEEAVQKLQADTSIDAKISKSIVDFINSSKAGIAR